MRRAQISRDSATRVIIDADICGQSGKLKTSLDKASAIGKEPRTIPKSLYAG